MSPKLTRWRVLPVSAFPQSIVLHCRVTLPFAELRQTLLVDAIDLGWGCLRLIRTESSPTSRPERNQSNRISSAGAWPIHRPMRQSSLRGITRHPPTTREKYPPARGCRVHSKMTLSPAGYAWWYCRASKTARAEWSAMEAVVRTPPRGGRPPFEESSRFLRLGKIGFVPLRSNSRNVGGTSVRNCAEYGHCVAMIWRACSRLIYRRTAVAYRYSFEDMLALLHGHAPAKVSTRSHFIVGASSRATCQLD